MFRFIPSLQNDPKPGVRPSGPTLNRWQRREIFREMALAELRYQNVDDWRRKRLVQYAATLQLSATEAGRMLQEAQKELERELRENQEAVNPTLTYVADAPEPAVAAWIPIATGIVLLAVALSMSYMLPQ